MSIDKNLVYNCGVFTINHGTISIGAIQCKCYSKPIGVSAVRDAYSGKAIYKCDVAIVMASNVFTSQAKEEADILGVKLWDRKYMEFFTNEYYLKK